MADETGQDTNQAPITLGYEALFGKHFRAMYNAALTVTRNTDDAEDAVQSVFARLMESRGCSPVMENPAAYLYRAAINSALDIVEGRKRRQETDTLDDMEVEPVAKSGIGSDRALQLKSALDKLNPEVLAIVMLHYQEGFTGDEIASIAGKTRSAVAKILERAREELREKYDGIE